MLYLFSLFWFRAATHTVNLQKSTSRWWSDRLLCFMHMTMQDGNVDNSVHPLKFDDTFIDATAPSALTTSTSTVTAPVSSTAELLPNGHHLHEELIKPAVSDARHSPAPMLPRPASPELPGPAAAAADLGLLSGPTDAELLADVNSDVTGALELDERAGGPPMPAAGIAAATSLPLPCSSAAVVDGSEDAVMASRDADVGGGDGMPGHLHDVGDVLPPMSADVDQPLDNDAPLSPVVDTSLPPPPSLEANPSPPSLSLSGVSEDVSMADLHAPIVPGQLPPTLAPATAPHLQRAPPSMSAVSTMPTPPSSLSPQPEPAIQPTPTSAPLPPVEDDVAEASILHEEPLSFSPPGGAVKRMAETEEEPPTKRQRKLSPVPTSDMVSTSTSAVAPVDTSAPVVPIAPMIRPLGSLPREQQKYAGAILRSLKKARDVTPFLLPVDPVALQIPQYFEFIKNPSDISTVEKRLAAHGYAVVEDFVADIRRIFTNCYTFNGPDSPISAMARNVEALFEKQLVKMPPVPIAPPPPPKLPTPPPPVIAAPPPPSPAGSPVTARKPGERRVRTWFVISST